MKRPGTKPELFLLAVLAAVALGISVFRQPAAPAGEDTPSPHPRGR